MEIKIIKKPNSYKTGGLIHIKKSHEGLFTLKADRAGMGVLEFASHVLANKENYSSETVKQANFARNAASWKHADGGNLFANAFAEGGTVLGGYHTNGADWQQPGGLHIIGNGGTHEENKNEGVLQGTDPNGVPNLVEENEVVYNDYVFSARLTVPKRRQGKDKELSDLAWEEKMLKPYEGKTYAEAALKAYKEVQERPNDPIARRGMETVLGILANSQEKERAKKEHQDAADQINEMSGLEFAQAKAAEEQQLAMEQAMQELAMQLQQMQELQMLEQLMQQPSPEEIAMMQLQLAMQQAGQAQIQALGGNIHAYGGNFYDNGGLLDLQRYQLIFQQIAEYAAANREQLPELFNAVSQVKTPLDMLEFVSLFLAAQEAQKQQLLTALAPALMTTEEAIITNPEGLQFAYGGHTDDGEFIDWWEANFGLRSDINWGKVYDSYFGTSIADDINNTYGDTSPSEFVQRALRGEYKRNQARFENFNKETGLFDSSTNTDSNKAATSNVDSDFTKEILLRELTEKEKEKARRQLNRYYRKKGIDPNKLPRVAAKRYEADLLTMYIKMQENKKYDPSKDNTLAINSDNLKQTAISGQTRRKNFDAYTNNAVYNTMVSMGATPVNVANGAALWDPISGLTIVDNSADNFYRTPSNFTEANGIYDYNDGSNNYNSLNFSSPEEFLQYYRDAITQRFKTLKGDEYNEARLPNYHLNASELRSWVNDLQNSDDPKAKELALALKANWGNTDTDWSNNATWNLKNRFNKQGTVTESDAYLNLDAVKANPLQTDALPGIEHIPYLEAILTNPTASRYFYTDPEGQLHFITRPTEGSGFTISGTPRTAKVGDITYNDYEVTGFGRDRKLYLTPDGRVLDVTNVAEDNWKPVDAVMQDDTSNLGEGVTGTSSWVNAPSQTRATGQEDDEDDEDEGVDFPLPSKWPWLAGLGLLVGTTLYNAIKPVDYSNADAVVEAAREAGNYQPIGFRPIGDYLTYRPLDRNYEGNKVRSAMAAERRALANLSGGNRGAAIAGILASDYNLINQLGDIDRKAAEANRAHEAQVAEFNRGTNEFNSEGFLKADMSNQDAMSRTSQAKLEGLAKGYAMRQAAEDAKASAVNAGLSGIAENLFGLYQQNYNNALIKYGMDTGTFGTANYNWKKNSGAQGGQLRTRRRRGLTF